MRSFRERKLCNDHTNRGNKLTAFSILLLWLLPKNYVVLQVEILAVMLKCTTIDIIPSHLIALCVYNVGLVIDLSNVGL